MLTAQITAAYLLTTGALIVFAGQLLQNRRALVALHVVGAAGVITLRRMSARHRLLAFASDWHPIVLFPLLYKEVESVAAAVGDWRLTTAIPAIEAAWFGGQPSVYLSQRFPSVVLSEWLHFCYLSYVVMIPGVAAYWYISRRRAFDDLVPLVATAMYASYLFFMLFPVDSPYYRTPRLGPPFAGHFFFDLVHAVSDRGGARGGAFPSAHVTGSLVLWLVAWRNQRRLALVLAPIVVGIVVATVYGRFHYVLDVAAGAALAAVVVVGGSARCRR
jgi:membrane-associated phospholipid phosphatase